MVPDLWNLLEGFPLKSKPQPRTKNLQATISRTHVAGSLLGIMSGRLIRQRRPNEASAFLAELERVGGAQAPCLREVQEAADLLDHEEFEHAGRDKTFAPVLFQICLRRRLRLPLMLSNRRCEGCRAILDSLGAE